VKTIDRRIENVNGMFFDENPSKTFHKKKKSKNLKQKNNANILEKPIVDELLPR